MLSRRKRAKTYIATILSLILKILLVTYAKLRSKSVRLGSTLLELLIQILELDRF